MKKLILNTIVLSLALFFPVLTMAMGRVDVGVSVPLPPAIVFSGSPNLVVIPETYVYADPDLDVDIFFYGGWWWRPWEGRWYRSRDYRSGWNHYQEVPSFYRQVLPGWRNSYREGRWKENQWEQQRMPHQKVQQNWNTWEKSRYWEKHNNWGVKRQKSDNDSRQQNQEEQRQSGPNVREENRDQDSQSRHNDSDRRDDNKDGKNNESEHGRNKNNKYNK
jgi:hypothetical protein